MRAVVQRTLASFVTSEGVLVGTAKHGLTVLVGVGKDDDETDVKYVADKIINLRIFEDSDGKMNLSLRDISGEMLIISQFTLYADVRHGRRPGFTDAAPPELAERLYNRFVDYVKSCGIPVGTGRFQTEMVVSLENHGPVTILVDSKKLF